jgi:hypothetical protein
MARFVDGAAANGGRKAVTKKPLTTAVLKWKVCLLRQNRFLLISKLLFLNRAFFDPTTGEMTWQPRNLRSVRIRFVRA